MPSRNEHPRGVPTFRPDMTKTSMCDPHRCRGQNRCTYAHSFEELRCKSFAFGRCKKNPCDRLHIGVGVKPRAGGRIVPETFTSQGTMPSQDANDRVRYVRPLPKSGLDFTLMHRIAQCPEEARKPLHLWDYRTDLDRDTMLINPPKMSVAKSFLEALTQMEFLQQQHDVRAYDQTNIRAEFRDGMMKIMCEGLAEKRPSVLRSDPVYLRDVDTGKWHLGYVHFVNLDHVMVDIAPWFQPRMIDVAPRVSAFCQCAPSGVRRHDRSRTWTTRWPPTGCETTLPRLRNVSGGRCHD
eukprot:PhM_4_TR16760/c3_g2_i3/m.75200